MRLEVIQLYVFGLQYSPTIRTVITTFSYQFHIDNVFKHGAISISNGAGIWIGQAYNVVIPCLQNNFLFALVVDIFQ